MTLASETETCRPEIFAETDREKIDARKRHAVVCDTIAEQLAELAETRNADRKLDAQQRAHEVANILAGRSIDSFGSWVYFPWSNRLVHLLPEDEFFELRTSRNRNKITRREQAVLASLTVGIAGLSVGQATALTLALEGVGGTMRLADFDRLSLSNMNRLRAGVHEIGLRKTTIVARAIFELNPYAKLELFDEGITDANIDRFMDSLDFLFEECDDLKMKVRLREEARRRRIPVLMETSDRGMMDVERFDLEPERPLFHGLAGDLDAAALEGLSTYEKVPIVLAIVGTKTMSRRAAASMIDIDATLKTWPQLGSAVALGSAVNTDVARRIALGKFRGSGRYFVDLENVVGDDAPQVALHGTVPSAPAAKTDPPVVQKPAARTTTGAIPFAVVERLVHLASLAPSGGNCQPWHFRLKNDVLQCFHDEERSRTLLDFEHRATYAAFGALSENLRLGAASLGIGIELRRFPDANDPRLVCEAKLGGEPATLSPVDRELLSQVELRVTNRRLSKRSPLRDEDAARLKAIAADSGAELRLLTEHESLDAIGKVIGMSDRLRLMSPVMHREMMGELRWSRADALRTRDGLDLATLELTATDEAGMRLISDWSVMEVVKEIEGGHGLAKATQKSIAAASAVGLVSFPRPVATRACDAYFLGGTAMQRVWLAANSLGYAFQPMTALIYLFARLEDGGGVGLEMAERAELTSLRAHFRSIFEIDPTDRTAEVMLFRLAIADPPTARSLRRHVHEVLEIA